MTWLRHEHSEEEEEEQEAGVEAGASGERASRRACLLWRNCLIRKVTSVCSDTYIDVSRICRHYCLTDN